jgi:hypothetical protein
VAQTAYAWWLAVLAPFAAAGYRTGILHPDAVTLTDGYREVTISRGGWATPSPATATESDEGALSAADVETLHALMRVA